MKIVDNKRKKFDSFKDTTYLEVSEQIYRWIEDKKIQSKDGIYYEVNPGALINLTDGAVYGKYSLYSGSAGVGLFLIRLYNATKNEKYLKEAILVANEMMTNSAGAEFYRDKYASASASELKITGWHIGVYTGPTGEGIFALELYKVTKDKKYYDFAYQLGQDLLMTKTNTENGIYFSGDLDCFSDAGFILYFISLYKVSKEQNLLSNARSIALYIAGKARTCKKGGVFWYANDLSKAGMPKDSIYPGFAHGSAGIAYAMLALYEYDKEEWELDIAKKAAEFIQAISDEVGEGVLIPYLYTKEENEEWKEKYYLGFCHGPAGTSLLYRKLFELTKNNDYYEFARKLTLGIIESGAPELNSWGMWNSYSLCCGTPGLLEYFVEMYEWTGDEIYKEYAYRAAKRIIRDSSKEAHEKICFYGNWNRTNPRDVQTYTGLYIGAAGAGAALLRLYANIKGTDTIRLFEYGYCTKNISNL